MSVDDSRMRGVTLVLVGLFAATMVGGPVSGQVSTPSVDVRVTDLFVPDPLVAGDDNTLSATVVNDSPVPQSVDVEFRYADDQGRSDRIHAVEAVLNPDERRTFSTTWAARHDGDTRLADPVEVTVEARPSSDDDVDEDLSNNIRSVSRSVHNHELSVDVEVPGQGDGVLPGGQAILDVTVRNLGDVDDVAVLELGPPDAVDWNFTLGTTSIALPLSDPVRTVVLVIEPPQDALAQDTASAVVAVASALVDPEDGSDEDAQTANSPPVLAVGGLTLAVPESSQADAGEHLDLEVDVQNDRNEPLDVQILFEEDPLDPPDTDNITLTPPSGGKQTIPAFGNLSFPFQVDIDIDTLAGEHAWVVKADATGIPTVVADDGFTLQVQPHRELRLQLTEEPGSLEPGAEYAALNDLHFRVSNDGNVNETVRIVPDGLPSGWALAESGPALQVELDAGEEEGDAVWHLSLPPDAPAGAHTVSFRAQSGADGTVQSDRVEFGVMVHERTYPVVSGPDHPLPIEADGSLEIPLSLQNLGNRPGDFTVTTDMMFQGHDGGCDPSGGCWSADVDPDAVELSVGASQATELLVSAPADLQVGDVTLVNVTMQSTGPDGDGRGFVFQVELQPAAPDLALEVVGTDPETPYLGHPVSLRLRVTNEGTEATQEDAAVRIVLETAAGGVEDTDHQVPPLDWRPGENEYVFSVPLPDHSPAVNVTAAVDPNAIIPDNDPTNNGVAETIALRSFDLTVHPPLERSVLPGQTVSMEGSNAFKVVNNNTGEHPDVGIGYKINVTPAWVSPVVGEVSLRSGAFQLFGTTVDVPSQLTTQDAVISFTAWSVDVPELTVTKEALLRVEDTQPPLIDQVSATRTVLDAGGAVTLSARVTDALGVDEVVGYLQGSDGEAVPVQMEPVGGDRYNATLDLTTPGEYQWFIHARDGSREGNRADTTSDPLVIIVRPVQTLTLEAASSQGPMQAGTVFQVKVKPLAFLVEASYRVGSTGPVVDLPLSNPLQIPTDDLPDGESRLTVHVVDAFTGANETEFTLTVDSSPPLIEITGIDPPSPRDGDRSRLSADIDDDVSGVGSAVLRVISGDGSVEDHDMVLNGSSYVADFWFSKGMTEFAVIAEDAAGNRGYLERALPEVLERQSVKDEKKESPSLLWSAPVVLFAVAALGRRRHDR